MGSNNSRGQRLQAGRRGSGLSADEIAAIVGVTRGQIYRYERDESEVPNDVLLALSRLYGVTTDYLLSGD